MTDTQPAGSVEADCCIVGGGPAGLVAGLLFARAGVRTVVLEKHGDFLRDFRGDTVHASTLEIMHELGLLQSFLKRPHQKLTRMVAEFGNERLEIANLQGVAAHCPFIAFMPQWEFLDFIAENADRYPNFKLLMRTEATGALEAGGRFQGVRATGPDGSLEIKARLTIAADGRRSLMRGLAGLKVKDIGAPIDVFWFRVPKGSERPEDTLLHAGPGRIVVTLDRGDYWQCACIIPKGGADRVRAAGMPAFRDSIARIVPFLAQDIKSLNDLDDLKLLTVSVDRLEEWHRPGLLCIGDAAHAMSPIGGVGINLAVQDAVAAANLLAGPLAAGTYSDALLPGLRERRLFPTRATQFVQVQLQNRLLAPILGDPNSQPRPPLFMRLIASSSLLKRRVARMAALGVRPEHVRSPIGASPLPSAADSG